MQRQRVRRSPSAVDWFDTLASMVGAAAIIVASRRARATQPPPVPAEGGRPDEPVTIEPAAGPLGALDAAQRRSRPLAFVAAVFKKYSDDAGGKLAAQLTYSGFLSLFPLLLVLTTVLGYVLAGRPDLQQRLVDSAVVQFPIIGDQLASNVGSLRGNGFALLIGLVTALWGGLGVANAAQDVLATVWMVPKRVRPGFLARLGRAVTVLAVLFGGLVSTAALTSVGSQLPNVSVASKISVIALSAAVNVGWFALAFKVLVAAPVRWREIWPGAVLAAVGWQVLLLAGGVLVNRSLRGATQSYGFFGIVLGLMAWIALLANLLVLAAEVNAVRTHGLWPRSLLTPALTESDRRALTGSARVEEQAPSERIDVAFHGSRASDEAGRTAA
jgi:inner membrane protein YhjD